MKDHLLKWDEIVITDPKAAQVLCNVKSRQYLQPFMREELNLTTAATALSIPANALHYWVQRFLHLRLLRITREESRIGRSSKYYQASANSFIVPHHLIPETHYESNDLYWMRRFWTALDANAPYLLQLYGIRISLESDSSLNCTPYIPNQPPWDPLDPRTVPALNTWSDSLELDYETAKALQRDLWQIFWRYRHSSPKSMSRVQRYILHIGLASIKHESGIP
jgi:hypothetical protein